MRNRLIFMIASNEASVVPADKNDRRWMVFDVGDAHREDHSYFNAISDQLENGGHEAMLYDLLRRDLTVGPDPRRIIKTEALFEQILHAQGPEIAYLHMIFDNGRLPQNWLEGPAITTVRALHDEMRRRFPLSLRFTEASLGRLMAKVFTDLRKAPNGKFFIKKTDEGMICERSTRYLFPTLVRARKQFQDYIGVPIRWNEEVGQWQSDPPPNDDEPDHDVF